ncbi:MAG: 16S rRNA (uracil(1498)-N(3))-methyltransferase [Magnetococcales bacterium]|nr:16S rRNA (uracil(1498)-N(3))-methyltransferase [Magnetococcales bacterium]
MSASIRLLRTPEVLEQRCPLTAEGREELARRGLPAGAIVTVTDPRGVHYRARSTRDHGAVVPFAELPALIEPPHTRRLAQALPDRERMIWIVQKAVELGATAIQPLITDHSAPRPGPGQDGGPRQDKSATWPRVARQAAHQCRRARVPEVAEPLGLDEFLAGVPAGETLVLLDVTGPREALFTLADRLWRRPLTLLVGPEGGWSDRERALLNGRGAVAVRLGERLLRTETAALAALALLAGADGTFTPEE